MKIRTLDEEPQNDNTLREVGAQAEMGAQATDIINMRNITGITFGVATGIDETVPNTAVTFGVATTKENKSTRATTFEAVEEIEVVAAINRSKTPRSEVISIGMYAM